MGTPHVAPCVKLTEEFKNVKKEKCDAEVAMYDISKNRAQFMKKLVASVLFSSGVLISFAVGFLFGKEQTQELRYFHANTVGMQIVEVNRLYEKMSNSGLTVATDWDRYNQDMLLLIDCGKLLDGIDGNRLDSSLKPFVDGLDLSWNMADSSTKCNTG